MTGTVASPSHRIEPLDPSLAPGLDEAARRLQRQEISLPTATRTWRALPESMAAAGPAWSDADWVRELKEQHVRLGAGARSLEHLRLLAEGSAACVVTGQQPGLMGGPLFCAYKIAGAVGLSQALAAHTNLPVVPVYWCGTDDSDFEEVRKTWFWSMTSGPFRGELPRHLWREGQRVGSVRGPALTAVEQGVLDHAGEGLGASDVRSMLARLDADLGLGERIMGSYLRLFAGSGLVVVDARSARLRQLGRPWFTRYASGHASLTAMLIEHSQRLRSEGLPTPLADAALQSGLFALDGDQRRKLDAPALSRALPEDVTPSVLLRALWQDALLGPAAAVLGPSELAYHAQLAPLYAALDVGAAAPVARPHLTLLPAGVPWPEDPQARRALLAGGESARVVLAEAALPAAWKDALRKGREMSDRAWGAVETQLDPVARRAVEGWPPRWLGEWDRLRDLLREPALSRRAREHPAWEYAPRWLSVRGVPQERALASWTGWWWWGASFGATLDELGRQYAFAVANGAPTTFVGKENA